MARSIDIALKEDRELKKVSMADLAEKSGIAENVIADIESGQYDPSDKERVALSVALGTPLPGVSGEVLDKRNGGALVRMAETLAKDYQKNAGERCVQDIRKFTKRLDEIAGTQFDSKKMKSALLKLKKAIAKVEGSLDEKS